MKALSDKKKQTADNAWGRSSTFFTQVFEVEESDVRKTWENKGGYGATVEKRHTFTRNDIGRTITVYTDGTEWACWQFNLIQAHGAQA